MDAGAKPASIIIDVHSTCTVPACDVTKLQTHCRLARAYKRSPDPASLVAWRSQFKRQRVLFERKFFEYWSRKISNSSGSSTTLWSHLRSAVSTCLDRYCAQSWRICQVILTNHSCSPVNVWFQPADHQLIGGYSGSIRKNARWSCTSATEFQVIRLQQVEGEKDLGVYVTNDLNQGCPAGGLRPLLIRPATTLQKTLFTLHWPVFSAIFTRTWLRYVRVFAVAIPSVVCLSVTLVHRTQRVEPLCTLAILWPPCKILRR